MYRQAQGDTASGKVEQEGVTTGFIEAVPVLALSYWAEGEPRCGHGQWRLIVAYRAGREFLTIVVSSP